MSGGPRILPVLVAGGGTTGLSLALFLAGHGVPCRLVERRERTSAHPRARGINPRVMEVMRQQGLETEIRATASARVLEGNDGVVVAESLVGRELGALDSAYFLGTRSDRRVPSPSGWCQCHQDEFEPVLRARAQQLGAVTDFGTELLSFTQDGDGVTAVLLDHRTGRTETARARYLVAADGPRSAVRRALGIPFDAAVGTGPFGTYLNIHFRAGLGGVAGRRCIICYVVNPEVRGGLMPLDNDRRWLLHVVLDPLSDVPEGGYGVERCRSLVRAATGIPSLAPEILGSALWHADARTAGTFRAGRVLLAGDAAHVMPPSGSFGANTGVLDAHNLAWKLAAVHRGQAGADLLDSYDAERRPVALATTRQAVLRSRDRLRLLGGPERPADPGIARDSAVWFGASYVSSAVLAAGEAPAGPVDPAGRGYWLERGDGRPGTRAPHVTLTRRGQEISALDLFGSAFVLLAGERAAPWAADAHRAARLLGVPLEIHRIGADGTTAAQEDDWHAAYGISPQGAVLVRPDGIVAWRSPGSHDAAGRSVLDVLTAVLSRTGAHNGPDATSASRRASSPACGHGPCPATRGP